MEKSIETIWKEGFLKSDALVAPKLNDLYNQKSKHIIDKLRRMFKINLVAIMIGALAILVGFILVGAPFTGAFLFLLFAWLVYYSKKQADKMEKIDKNVSSYQYLKAFDNWLKEVISNYTRIYRFFYPTFFLVFTLGLSFSSLGKFLINKVGAEYPDIYLVYGIPLYWMLGTILFACIMSIFAGKIYQLDIKLVYGHVLKKLNEIIADMEELRS